MKITVAGAGYVGLSLAILFAQENDVTVVNVNPAKAKAINNWTCPFQDNDIDRFFNEAKAGTRTLHLRATTSESAYETADIVVVATPTNYDEQSQFFDTSAVESVIETVLALNPAAFIVIKSTVPVGYTDSIREQYGISNIAFSPEFLREGKALYDNLHPSRIVVGAHEEQKEQAQVFANLLAQGALEENVPVLLARPTEAEAIKLFSNTYLATRVAFFNELDTYAQIKGLSTKEIIEGVCLDPRIGTHYNNPSFGYGGYCLPKDSKQLLANYKNVPQDMIGAVVSSNATRKRFIAEQVLARKPKCVGVYRLAMKSSSDNFRASAILDIMHLIDEGGCPIIIFEPTLEGKNAFDDFPVVHDLDRFKAESDLILANRFDETALSDVRDKVFTRDLFGRD